MIAFRAFEYLQNKSSGPGRNSRQHHPGSAASRASRTFDWAQRDVGHKFTQHDARLLAVGASASLTVSHRKVPRPGRRFTRLKLLIWFCLFGTGLKDGLTTVLSSVSHRHQKRGQPVVEKQADRTFASGRRPTVRKGATHCYNGWGERQIPGDATGVFLGASPAAPRPTRPCQAGRPAEKTGRRPRCSPEERGQPRTSRCLWATQVNTIIDGQKVGMCCCCIGLRSFSA